MLPCRGCRPERQPKLEAWRGEGCRPGTEPKRMIKVKLFSLFCTPMGLAGIPLDKKLWYHERHRGVSASRQEVARQLGESLQELVNPARAAATGSPRRRTRGSHQGV